MNELSAILSAHGHEVVPFAMRHADNWPTPYERFFVEKRDLKDTTMKDDLLRKAGLLPKIVYSVEARKNMEALLDYVRPDFAHLFSIAYQLTPSIISPIRKRGIPIVISVNEYKLVCPNQRLYIQHRYEICERCLGSRYYNAPIQKCIKGSFMASLVGAIETYLYELMKTYKRHIDMFIVATDFMKGLLEGVGIARDRICKLYNPLRLKEYAPSYENKGYIVYFGRLAEEKGVKTLLDAVLGLPGVRLKVVGGGQEEHAMREKAGVAGSGIEFLGPVWGDGLKDVLAGAKFIVVPSEWYENSPYVVYQSFAMGKPVVGSRIRGGIPELVRDGENGLLFEPCNSGDLREKIGILYNDDRLSARMGRQAREDAERFFGEEKSYQSFMEVYERVLLGRTA